MKRFTLYLSLLLTLFSSCRTHTAVPKDSLTILSGISNNTLTLDGYQGATTTFAIRSKLDWQVLATNGIIYSPNSGIASDRATIEATATEANNTLSLKYLGDVIIRLDHTRFTGIVAYQRPQIILSSKTGTTLTLGAEQGQSATLEFECATSDFDVIAEGDITIDTPKAISGNKYAVTVSTTIDNLTSSDHQVGTLKFKVAGEAQQGKVDVVQQPALILESSRITINGTVGATTEIAVISPFDFTATSSSEALTITRGDGNTIILTANEQNDGDSERKMAVLTLTLTDNPACTIDVDVWQRKAFANQAMLFYMLGTSLGSYYETNISMIELFASDHALEDLRIIIYKQSSTNAGATFELSYDKGSNKVVRTPLKQYTLPAVYNEQMMAEIIADMVAAAPALEYGLYIGSHGKGWIPKSQSGKSSLAALEHDIWTVAPGAAMVRHLGDNADTQVNIDEFAGAIQSCGKHMGYIIFDVCFMANIESIYTMRNCADYILASPCEVMASGMPYNQLLPAMVENQSIKSRLENASKIYVDYYKLHKEGIYSSACSVVVDCHEIEALAEVTKRVNSSLKDIDPDTIQYYDGVSASRNPTHIFFDFEHYVELSCTDSAMVTEFKVQLDRTLSGQQHTTNFYSAYNNRANPITNYSGLTTSAPIMLNSASAYREQWQQTEWYKATH